MVELAEYCPPRPLDYLASLSYRHRSFMLLKQVTAKWPKRHRSKPYRLGNYYGQ